MKDTAATSRGSGGAAPQACHTTRLLKIGLATSVLFNFLWVGQQLSSLEGAPGGASETALVAPAYAADGRDVYAAPSSPSSPRRPRAAGASSSSSSSSSPFDPRGGADLPTYPSPNAALRDLVASHRTYACPENLVFVEDHILPDNVTHPPGRRIPRLLHVTSKSRCMTPVFANNINRWKAVLGSKYSVYIHDDEAVNKFIYQRRWTEFPELKEIMSCVTAGAAKIDIWRYVMLWEHGGVYSDIDSAARKFDADSVAAADDAFFVVEVLGIPAQYFFAASPRHPVMYLSAKHALQTLAFRPDIALNLPAKTTGPAGFKTGFILFLRCKGVETNGYDGAGLFVGAHDRSVRVVGDRGNSNEWVDRESVKAKGGNYAAMGMTRFHDTLARYKDLHPNQGALSCLDQRYKMQVEFTAEWDNII